MRVVLAPFPVVVVFLAACGAQPVSTPPSPAPTASREVTPAPPVEAPSARGPVAPVAISDAPVPSGFGLGPGFVYFCDRTVRAVPKQGGEMRELGPCQAPTDFRGDGDGIYYCERGGVTRLPANGGVPRRLVHLDSCILETIDAEDVYYIVPGFGRSKSPGLYRVGKRGGTPVRLHGTSRGEQIMLALDGDDLWIASWSAGTIVRLPRAGGRPTQVVTGQKGVVSLATDASSLYWYAEGTGEIRRRPKAGGPIEVVGRGVDQEPLLVHAGHAYWFEGARAEPKRLMHLAPGETQAEPLATDLTFPALRIDDEGIFFTVSDRPGIFRLPPPSS